MMFKKIAMMACMASALMMASAPANAAAYFIGGKWYFFSLDFEAAITKLNGKDLRTGTVVTGSVNIVESDVLCVNPQSKFITPGKGPQVRASGTSDPLLDENLTKDQRYPRNTFITVAQVDLSPPAAEICKTSNGQGSWKPVYWQNKACSKGTQGVGLPACYSDLAVKEGQILVYASTGLPVPGDLSNWNFAYLPTKFEYTATLLNNVSGEYDVRTGTCQFGINPTNGAPYSISNPPNGGWSQPGAADPVYYECP